MSIEATRALKQHLLDVYGHFADKRIRNLDAGERFIVDDRTPNDLDARKQFYSWFCQIFVDVVDQDSVKVILRGDVPHGALVAQWLSALGAQQTTFGTEILVHKGAQTDLKGLAAAFRSIVAAGARYPVSSYKYTCPRTADAMDRLADTLDRAWVSG